MATLKPIGYSAAASGAANKKQPTLSRRTKPPKKRKVKKLPPGQGAPSPDTNKLRGGHGKKANLKVKKKLPSEQEYLKSDAGYLQESGDLKSQYARYLAELKANESNYNTNFNTALNNLGFQGGKWNEKDRLSQYGSAMTGQLQDFTGRGLRDSTFFLDARGDQQAAFNRQLAEQQGLKQQQQGQFNMQRTGAAENLESAMQRARLEALLRRAQRYGLDV